MQSLTNPNLIVQNLTTQAVFITVFIQILPSQKLYSQKLYSQKLCSQKLCSQHLYSQKARDLLGSLWFMKNFINNINQNVISAQAVFATVKE